MLFLISTVKFSAAAKMAALWVRESCRSTSLLTVRTLQGCSLTLVAWRLFPEGTTRTLHTSSLCWRTPHTALFVHLRETLRRTNFKSFFNVSYTLHHISILFLFLFHMIFLLLKPTTSTRVTVALDTIGVVHAFS